MGSEMCIRDRVTLVRLLAGLQVSSAHGAGAAFRSSSGGGTSECVSAARGAETAGEGGAERSSAAESAETEEAGRCSHGGADGREEEENGYESDWRCKDPHVCRQLHVLCNEESMRLDVFKGGEHAAGRVQGCAL